MRYLLGVDFGGGSSKATLIDEEGHIIWKRRLPHPGDGPKHQKKGSDGAMKDLRWNEKQQNTKRVYGEAPSAIVYDINKIFDNQAK